MFNSFVLSTKKKDFVRTLIVLLIFLVMLVPRIPIMPVGYGDLAIRIDGVASALAGILALYELRAKLVIIPLVALLLLYLQNPNIFVSIGLFLQVISILSLPFLISSYGKKDIIFKARLLLYFRLTVVTYALINVIIAVITRYYEFSYCNDSLTNTGCVGEYGLLDRPYVFAIFIGAGFVLICANQQFSFLKALISIYGLLISDSRSIAAIMFVLGSIVYLNKQKISFRKFIVFISMLIIILSAVSLGQGKMSFSHVSNSGVDPSWLMRVNSINQYMEWVNLKRTIIGEGALAFYQFSEQYGLPGPMDNLYFRIASEVGILGGLILLLLYVYPIYSSSKKYKHIYVFISYVAAVLIISVFQESLITPRAGHVLVMLGIYLSNS